MLRLSALSATSRALVTACLIDAVQGQDVGMMNWGPEACDYPVAATGNSSSEQEGYADGLAS